ncbi:hypothetical protein Hanom_Chr14g01327161 [Helianthus anomalus]
MNLRQSIYKSSTRNRRNGESTSSCKSPFIPQAWMMNLRLVTPAGTKRSVT